MTQEHEIRIHQLVAEHAIRMPEAIAIVDANGSEHSYGQYQAAIVDAAVLLSDHGVVTGDRVLLVAENCLTTAVFIFAASSVGAYIIPVNARMTAAEIRQVTEHALPRLTVFTTGASAESASHAVKANAVIFDTGYGTFGLAVSQPDKPDDIDADGTAAILYTTGTTGAPKGVMLTHANLRFSAKTSATLRGLVASDHVYGVLPLTHVFGFASMLMASCHAGAKVQLETRFRPDLVYTALMNGVSVFPGVPQMHALVMQYASEQGLTRLENSQLRYVSSGAAPLDPAWKRKAEDFYGVALQNGYGMTETTAAVCATSNAIGTDDTSVGPALAGISIRLDTASKLSSDAGTGEVLTRGPHVMKGYFRNAAETARTIDADGWLRTGDLGRIDHQGNLHIVGRSKELIIRGGFNVYPPEVEAALNDHPDVIQCAVVGRKLDTGDEEILAFVQCADPDSLDTAALAQFVAERLVSYKRPSRIIATALLPAAATGKILKHKLVSTFAGQLATS